MSPREVPVTAHSPLTGDQLERASAILRAHATLQHVLDWCRAQDPPADLASVVVQDEFTHDIVLALGEELFAVYDTT